MTKTKKPAKQPTPEQLQRRMDKACNLLADIATWPDHWDWDYQTVDQAVRVLQGNKYKNFVARIEKENDNHPCHYWRTGKEDKDS